MSIAQLGVELASVLRLSMDPWDENQVDWDKVEAIVRSSIRGGAKGRDRYRRSTMYRNPGF